MNTEIDYSNRDQILGLLTAPPLESIIIDGVEYPLGTLNETQWADVTARGNRIIEAGKSGTELSDDDRNPARDLWHLLLAGNPDLRQVGRISRENIRAAGREMMRQAVVRATSPDRCKGSA